MHQEHLDAQGAQHRHVQQDVGEILAGDDGAIHADDESLLPKARDVLQNASQVGEFHNLFADCLPLGITNPFSARFNFYFWPSRRPFRSAGWRLVLESGQKFGPQQN
jgi:hypothetical protein